MMQIEIKGNNVHTTRGFPREITLGEFRQRQEIISGIPPNLVHLHINNVHYPPNVSNDVVLGNVVGPGGLVQVSVSNNPESCMVVEMVDKYEMEDDKYDQLNDSVRAFKKKMGLGRFGQKMEEPDPYLPVKLEVNQRCQVNPTPESHKRGWIRYIGPLPGKLHTWIGVEYDEPVGKHNGTYQETQLFQCKNNHGAFVRPDKVEMGDFPEELDQELMEF